MQTVEAEERVRVVRDGSSPVRMGHERRCWFDRRWPPDDGKDFARDNAAIEWGITNHWMADGRATAISDGETRFNSARFETRYRFLEEGELPVDVATSFEVSSEREPDGSTTVGLEPQVILCRDFTERTRGATCSQRGDQPGIRDARAWPSANKALGPVE